MAIPKRKARLIEVDGQPYHWCANQKGVVSDLTLSCQPFSGHGAILVVRIPHVDRWYRISVETGSHEMIELLPPNEILAVTPSLVASAIRFGLSNGWNPKENVSTVALRYRGGQFRRDAE